MVENRSQLIFKYIHFSFIVQVILRVLKNLCKPQNSWCMDYFNHLTPMEVYSYGQKRTW